MIRPLLLAAMTLCVCACGGSGAVDDAGPVSAEEYAIYSAVLRAEVLPEHEGFPLLMDSTWSVGEGTMDGQNLAYQQVTDSVRVPRAMFRRLARINQRRHALTPSFSPGADYRMLSDSAFRALYRPGARDEWVDVRKRIPGTLGKVEFSRAAIDPRRDLALVYWQHECGLLCASGNLVLLRRDAGRWRVIDSSVVWVS